MSDSELRKLEREAANDPTSQEKLDRVRLRSGALTYIWALQYSKDSVGLDGTIVGLFTNRQAAVDHIKSHEKHFRPGHHSHSYTIGVNRDESFNHWTNGYRGLVITKVPIHSKPAEKWFASHL